MEKSIPEKQKEKVFRFKISYIAVGIILLLAYFYSRSIHFMAYSPIFGISPITYWSFIIFLVLIIFVILEFVIKDRKKEGFPIKGKKWIVFIIGLWGGINLFFWIYQGVFYLMKNKGDKFFSMEFYKRIYYWGWIIIVMVLTVLMLGTISYVILTSYS